VSNVEATLKEGRVVFFSEIHQPNRANNIKSRANTEKKSIAFQPGTSRSKKRSESI
jgi:ADP-heptose:LPS heptosyltransferase